MKISKSFRVPKRTQLVKDRQIDRQLWEQQFVLPDVGRHKMVKLTSVKFLYIQREGPTYLFETLFQILMKSDTIDYCDQALPKVL